MSFSIQVDDDEVQVALCTHSDGSGVIAAYLVPGSAADAKDALPRLDSMTGHDGRWDSIPLSGTFKHGRKGSATR